MTPNRTFHSDDTTITQDGQTFHIPAETIVDERPPRTVIDEQQRRLGCAIVGAFVAIDGGLVASGVAMEHVAESLASTNQNLAIVPRILGLACYAGAVVLPLASLRIFSHHNTPAS